MPDEAKIEPWIEVAAQKIADLEDDAGYTVRAGAFVPVIAEAYRSRESANETRKELIERLSFQVAVNYEFDGDTDMANMDRAIGEAYDAGSASHGPLLDALKKYGRHSQDCDSHAPLTIRDNRVEEMHLRIRGCYRSRREGGEMRYLVLFLLAGIAMGQAIPFSFTLAGDVSHVQPGDCFKVSPTYTLEKIDCPAKAAFVPTGDLIAPKSEPACDPRTCGTRVGFFSVGLNLFRVSQEKSPPR